MQSGKRISQSASGRELRHLLVISLFTSSSYVSGPWSPMEIIDTLRSLADDVENNRVEDTDAVDRVRVLGDRIDDLSSLVRFDASVVNTKISQVLQARVANLRNIGSGDPPSPPSPHLQSSPQPSPQLPLGPPPRIHSLPLPPLNLCWTTMYPHITTHYEWVPGHSAVEIPLETIESDVVPAQTLIG